MENWHLILKDYPDETGIIGSLVVGYGDLEFWFASCLAETLSDTPQAIRLMFRIRSESQRINIADALLDPAFEKFGLSPDYDETLRSVRHCLRIRNQYAHCHWRSKDGQLSFCNLEEFAKKSQSTLLHFRRLDLLLLNEQQRFFEYTRNWLYFLLKKIQAAKKGSSLIPGLPERPPKLPQPSLYIPQNTLQP